MGKRDQLSLRDEAGIKLQFVLGCGIQFSGVQYVIMFHQDEGKSSSSENQPPSSGGVAASKHRIQQVT